MEYMKLGNGLHILFHQMLNTHSVTLGLYIKAGSGYENADQRGITHFLEHLHFRRSGSMSQEELYYRMESIGTDLRGKTYYDFLEYSMKLVPSKIEEGVAIFKELIETNEWRKSELEQERQVVINQIKEKESYFSVDDEIRKCVFRNSPLAGKIMGTVEDVQHLHENDIKKYKKEIFNKNNLLFCITGCVESAKLKIIQKELEMILLPEGIEKPSLIIPQVFHCRKPDVVFKITRDNLLDVNLSFDISGDEKKGEFLTILNCILGEGVGSSLQKRVREKLGYTSDIYSYLEKYRGFCVLHIRFSVERWKLLQCLEEVIQVINELKENVSIADLDVSLPFYTSNLVFLEDDTSQMNFQLAYHNFILDDVLNKEILKKDGSTIVEIQRLAQIIFKPWNASIVIIGNANRISKRSIRSVINGL